MEYANIFTDIAIAIWVVMYLAIGIIILRATRYGDVVAMIAGDGAPKTALAMLLGFMVLWPLYPLIQWGAILYEKLPRVKRRREIAQAVRDCQYNELNSYLNIHASTATPHVSVTARYSDGTEFYGKRMK